MTAGVITKALELYLAAVSPMPVVGVPVGVVELVPMPAAIVPREMGGPARPAKLIIGPLVPMTPDQVRGRLPEPRK